MAPYTNIQPTPHILPGGSNKLYGHQNMFRGMSSHHWYSCREEFHNTVGTGKHKPKGFYYGADDPYSLAAIIDWVEWALNLKQEQKVKISLCQKNVKQPLEQPHHQQQEKFNTVLFELSYFWQMEKIRFYFLTILCRSHRGANWHHPLDAILQVHYFNNSRRAVGMFLDGYTRMAGKYNDLDSNWCQLFSNDVSMTECMARPSTPDQLKYFNDDSCVPNLLPFEKHRITQWVQETEDPNNFTLNMLPFGF